MRSSITTTLVIAVLITGYCLLVTETPAQAPELLNYQGRVVLNGTNFDGQGIFKFALGDNGFNTNYWANDGALGGEPSASITVTVTRGLFSVKLGDTSLEGMTEAVSADVFSNSEVWLRTWFNDGASGAQQLTPDQQIVSVGYAMRADGVTTGSVTTAMLADDAVTGDKLADNSVTSTQIVDGSIEFDDIGQNGASGGQGMIWNGTEWSNVTVGGVLQSYSENGSFANTPSASGTDAIAQGDGAIAAGDFGVVGGGRHNTNAADYAVIDGGMYNSIGPGSDHAAIGGGRYNTIVLNATNATIGGGYLNEIGTNSLNTTIVGGYNNRIGSNCNHATVLGGLDNMAAGYASAAAGRQAKALHRGSFVWADATGVDFSSTTNDQFLVRAGNGVGINTAVTPEALAVGGAVNLGDSTAATPVAGTIRWSGSDFEGYNGSAWVSLTGVGGASSVPDGMVYIPGGTFQMGDNYEEGNSGELPVHYVYVSPFLMDKYEVTSNLWNDVYTWATSNAYSFDNAGTATSNDHPVHTISWYDSVKWCNARSQKEGLTPVYYRTSALSVVYTNGQTNLASDCVNWSANGYRLPTEAEWEKAARGGFSHDHYPWPSFGSNYTDHIDGARANYLNSGDPYDNGTTPVGYYNGSQVITGSNAYTNDMVNGYGLYDMAGNLWEWCWDWSDGDWYSQPEAVQNDTTGPVSGSIRVLRGGSCFDSDLVYLRCAIRIDDSPDITRVFYGFRCSRGL